MITVFFKECPLCNADHPPAFFVFVKRTYINGDTQDGEQEIVFILVPRLFCNPNYQKRTSTGEKLPYTITVLPGFLVPYSRIPVDTIHTAVDSYLSTPEMNQQEAASLIHCEEPASFRLYLQRVHERLAQWITCIVEQVIQLDGQIAPKRRQKEKYPPNRTAREGKWFILLVSDYHRLYCRLPGTLIITERFLWQYLYALFSRRRMGLGP